MTQRLYRFIRKKELPQYVGLGMTSIDNLVKSGEFPKPVPLNDSGRAVAWLEAELIEWQARRLLQRRNVASPGEAHNED